MNLEPKKEEGEKDDDKVYCRLESGRWNVPHVPLIMVPIVAFHME